MRFFKYFFFLILLFVSSFSNAASTYSASGNFGTSPKFSSKQAACAWFTSIIGEQVIFQADPNGGQGFCVIKSNGGGIAIISKDIIA